MATPINMNTYVITEARHLLKNDSAYKNLTYEEAKKWLKENENWENTWLGFPEGEMAGAYHRERKMVCRFLVWIYEAPDSEKQEMIARLNGYTA